MEEKENHMIKGLIAGREYAYERLFEDYYRPLSIFASKYTADLETAKEIVQDLFVSLYENRSSLIINTSLRAYLYQSTRNRCLNHLKHISVERKHLDHLAFEQETNEDLDARIDETELEHRIFRIVSSLPSRCQKIFTLSRVRGMKNQEIADHLNISKRTVETQISNALKALREQLGEA